MRALPVVEHVSVSPNHHQRGYTLVELLVYVSLFVIVLAIVGGFLINSLSAEKGVRGAANASNHGQLLAQSLQHGIRNAKAIRVTQPPVSAAAPKFHPAGMQLLVVESMTGATDPAVTRCQAWLYTPSRGGQMFVRNVASGPITVPNLASSFVPDPSLPSGTRVVAPSGWALYGEDVKPTGALPFSATATGVSFDLALTVPGSDPMTMRGAESSRQTLAGSSTCF